MFNLVPTGQCKCQYLEAFKGFTTPRLQTHDALSKFTGQTASMYFLLHSVITREAMSTTLQTYIYKVTTLNHEVFNNPIKERKNTEHDKYNKQYLMDVKKKIKYVKKIICHKV